MKDAKKNVHYINNKDFSLAVVDYVEACNAAKENGKEVPIVPNYIAECFLKLCEGLSHKANFVRYTYREEMVMDGVENCLAAIRNYNVEAATRTGRPNAFAYFTQIAWYAFIRRIQREKKQQDIKLKYISEMGIEHFITEGSQEDAQQIGAFVEVLKDRIDKVKETDAKIKEYAQEKNLNYKKRRRVNVDSDLSEFLDLD